MIWGRNLDMACRVSTLDERCLIINKKHNIKFDEKLGWHLYGSDYALTCKQRELGAFVVAGECSHNYGKLKRRGWLKSTIPSRKLLAQKWGNEFGNIYTTIGKIKRNPPP